MNDQRAVVNLIGVVMQCWKAHHACFPLCSSAGIHLKGLNMMRSPLVDLEAWACAVFNKGLDDGAEDSAVSGTTIPDVVVYSAEEREAAEINHIQNCHPAHC